MSREENPQVPPSQAPYPPPYGYFPQEDEISLIDLWRVLIKKKATIFGLTALATIGAILFALVQPPVYKAETTFLPPVASDIQPLNVQGVQGVQGVSIDSVYSIFKRNLRSKTLQRRFFTEQNLTQQLTSNTRSSEEQLFQEFTKMVSIGTDKKNKEHLSLSIEWNNPEQAAEWVNQLAQLANQESIRQLSTNLRNAVDNRVREIEYTIASKRKMAQQRREDRITLLEEAQQTAEILNIEDRLNTQSLTQSVQPNNIISINNASTPLYYRGTKALRAEISTLKSRPSNDPFISGLRDLQEELSRLRSVTIDESVLHATTIDQAAFPPEQRIKPKRKLIVVLGFVLGLMLGIFGAFFINFLENQRREEETTA